MAQLDPLPAFLEIYQQMKPAHWRSPEIESRPRASKRVLALAREFHPGGTWQQAIDSYLAAYQLALRTAAGFPIFSARTTCWTFSSPAAVRRLAGVLSTVTDADLLEWESQVTWLRLPAESLEVLRLLAARQGRSAPGLAAELLEVALDRLIEGESTRGLQRQAQVL